MAIDRIALARELNQLRELAKEKWKEDPLPTGRDAEVRLRKEIQELGLESHIADLETDGYTVLPPGKAASPRTRCPACAAARQGCRWR